MPPIARRLNETGHGNEDADEFSPETCSASDLNDLADHCLAAHALIQEHGTPTMRRLIDLLLFEIGAELGSRTGKDRDLN